MVRPPAERGVITISRDTHRETGEVITLEIGIGIKLTEDITLAPIALGPIIRVRSMTEVRGSMVKVNPTQRGQGPMAKTPMSATTVRVLILGNI
jgi:hypothetical protein